MKKCSICGKHSGKYPLCIKHLKMKNEGTVIKKDGLWIELEKTNKDEIINNTSCIICNSSTNKSYLCNRCKKDTISFEDLLDKNKPPFELKDHYFNLRSSAYRIVSFQTIIRNCKMLIAISNVLKQISNDNSLYNRVVSDIKDIITSKQKIEYKTTSYTEQSDSVKSSIMRTLDGHIVKSYGEVEIDDILFNNQICHCYEKEVVEISSTQRCMKSDWFIPVVGNKGIYIEYWGMNTQEYLINKEQKKKLYKENNIPLIEIEKDDTKDKTGLTTRLLREIKTWKEEIKKSI